ncbi:putative zinc transporter [Drosera capensis]
MESRLKQVLLLLLIDSSQPHLLLHHQQLYLLHSWKLSALFFKLSAITTRSFNHIFKHKPKKEMNSIIIIELTPHFDLGPDDVSGFLVSPLFGVGPLLGGIILVAFALAFNLQHSLLTGIACGIAFVLRAWQPLHQQLDTSITPLMCGCCLPCLGRVSSFGSCCSKSLWAWSGHHTPRCFAWIDSWCSRSQLHLRGDRQLAGVPGGLHSDGIRESFICYWSDYHGNNYNGLDHLMVVVCGGLIPIFLRIVRRTLKLDKQKSGLGGAIGLGFSSVCLTLTKLVCLYTPYCNSASEVVRSRFFFALSPAKGDVDTHNR